MSRFNHTEKFTGTRKFSGSSRKFTRRDDDGPRTSRPKSFGRRDDDSDRKSSFQLHTATCDACGRECDLPFKPTGGKPVYCRACFRKNNSGESGSDFNRSESRPRRDFDRPERSFDKPEPSFDKEKLEQIEKKLDKIMKFLKIN